MSYNPVAPFTGAWIEIVKISPSKLVIFVAPFTGAWIEIMIQFGYNMPDKSLPSRGRGLKFSHVLLASEGTSRSLHGGVD